MTVLRRVITTGALLVLGATFVVGSGKLSLRSRLFGAAVPAAEAVLFSPVAGAGPGTAAPTTVLRSEAWWQPVKAVAGNGSETLPTVAIAGDALQWRVHWTCAQGTFAISTAARPPFVAARCPGAGTAYSTTSARRPRSCSKSRFGPLAVRA